MLLRQPLHDQSHGWLSLHDKSADFAQINQLPGPRFQAGIAYADSAYAPNGRLYLSNLQDPTSWHSLAVTGIRNVKRRTSAAQVVLQTFVDVNWFRRQAKHVDSWCDAWKKAIC